MNRELLEALVRASAELQRAFKIAVDNKRDFLAYEIRRASSHVTQAIAECVPDKSVVDLEEAS